MIWAVEGYTTPSCNITKQTFTVDPLYSGHLGTRRDCPDNEDVLISGVEDVSSKAKYSESFASSH